MSRDAYWECREAIERARLGYLFANGQLTDIDAGAVIRECREMTGYYPLEAFSLDGVLDAAGCYWSNTVAEIEPYARRACERVYDKWCSTGDAAAAAEDWAIDLISEYAAE